jgi:hypothetical protein
MAASSEPGNAAAVSSANKPSTLICARCETWRTAALMSLSSGAEASASVGPAAGQSPGVCETWAGAAAPSPQQRQEPGPADQSPSVRNVRASGDSFRVIEGGALGSRAKERSPLPLGTGSLKMLPTQRSGAKGVTAWKSISSKRSLRPSRP